MHVASLYRYPVKGLSAERLPSVQVATGEGFPLDRSYALLRSNAGFDPAAPAWLAKANFVMLMLHEDIANLRTRYSPQDQALHVCTLDGIERSFMLETATGRAEVEQFFFEFMPNDLTSAPRLVKAAGHPFTDKTEPYLSLINLASLRELEQQWGQGLDPLRFRANVYIDDAAPFSEMDWVGREIQLGALVAKVEKRNGRCAATNVNPDTGARDRDVPGMLRATFGHKDLGVYLRVVQGGLLRESDPVVVTTASQVPSQAASVVANTLPQLMCAACYFLFDPHEPHTAFSSRDDIPEGWRCPDCGATRERVVRAAT